MKKKVCSTFCMKMSVCFFLFLFIDLHVFAAESKIDKAAIKKAWEAKQERIKTVELIWENEENKPQLDKAGVPSEKIFTEKQQVKMLIDNGKISFQSKVLGPLQIQGVVAIKEKKVVYNGEQAKELNTVENLNGSAQFGTIFSAATFPLKNNLTCISALLGLRPLDPNCGNIDIEKSILQTSRKFIGEKSCLILDLPEQGTALVYRYWIDPKADFSILRFQNVVKEKDVISVDISYSEVNKEWIPTEWEYTWYNPNTKKLVCSGKSTVIKSNVNVPVDSKAFTLDFPEGVPIYDEKKGEDFVLGPDGKRLPLHSLQKRSESKSSSLLRWTLVSAGILLIGFGIYKKMSLKKS